jgi:hypothetical protein
MNVLSIVFGPLVDLVKSYTSAKAEQKARSQQLDQALQEKRLELVASAQNFDQAFRLAQVQTAGWRPGYLTILISMPALMAFVPFLVDDVMAGFKALDQMPEYYRYFLGVTVSSAFGLGAVDKAYEWWKAP